MARCEAKTKTGQCRSEAGENKWCHYHRQKYSRMVKHGLSASPELVGIPKNRVMTYKEFLAKEKPFELFSEIAHLRTLLTEVREALNCDPEERASELCSLAKDCIVAHLTHKKGMSPEKAEKVATLAQEGVYEAFQQTMGGPKGWNLLDKERRAAIKLVSDLIEQVANVAEKAKRIQDGITIHVQIDTEYLVKFIQDIVFRVVHSPHDRGRILNLLQRYRGDGTFEPVPAADDARILEAEYTVVENDTIEIDGELVNV